ncbi:MAG: CusA/CzcA family heavy metal efflux RND transporter, partial [Pseudomonadota bacterium]
MIERIVEFSVRRRWLVLFLVLGATLSGIWSLTRLPIDAVPDVTNVQVQVNAVAPALTPLEIEKQVTVALETALAGIPGMEATRSFSRNGFAQITVVFADRTNIYFARQMVTERINDARSLLPPNVDVRLGPVSTGLGEIYWWAVEYEKPGASSPVRDGQPGWQSDGSYLTPEGERLGDEFNRTVYLRTVQDWIIRPQMRSVRGVAGADAIGGFVKQFQVQPDPQKLIGLGITLDQIITAVEKNNASRGANYIEQNGEGLVVRAAGRVEYADDIARIVVSTRGGVPVRVRDVAEVVIGRELRTGSASANGREIVLGTALMLVGENSRTVAAAAAAKIDEINKTLPSGIRARTVLNRTELVDATIRTVATNLAEGALLVVAVLFLMLGNFRAALVTACVIPITMMITATGMLGGRISANLMSLGALDFGLIVDGAVIIAENSLRHFAERQAALRRTLTREERLETVSASTIEMIRPTVYGQAIIILVYAPLLAFTGVEGKTFEPMALTVMIALAVAFVVSLTFVPAAIAIAITKPVREKENFLVHGLKSAYVPLLSRVMGRPAPVAVAAALLFAGALMLFSTLGQEFTPTLDEKNIVMEVKRVPSTSITQSQAMQLQIEKL